MWSSFPKFCCCDLIIKQTTRFSGKTPFFAGTVEDWLIPQQTPHVLVA